MAETNPFALVETTVVDAMRAAVGPHVREVATHPGPWDATALKQRLRNAPGVFLAFLSAQQPERAQGVQLDSRWIVYVLARNYAGEAARRRGSAGEVGAWELLAVLLPVLEGLPVPGVTTMRVASVNNGYTPALDTDGLALYAIALRAQITIDLALPDSLADFATFDAQYDVDPMESGAEHAKWLAEPPDHTTSAPDAHDTVTDLDT